MKPARPTTDAVLRERLRKADAERKIMAEATRVITQRALDIAERAEWELFSTRLSAGLVVAGLIALAWVMRAPAVPVIG